MADPKELGHSECPRCHGHGINVGHPAMDDCRLCGGSGEIGQPKLRRRYHPLGWSIDDVFLDGKLIGFVIHRELWEAANQRGDVLGTASMRRLAVQMVVEARHAQ